MKHIDPVCGMTVKEGSEAEKYEYKGNTYYFCSEDCFEEFKADPKKYVKEEEKHHKGCCH